MANHTISLQLNGSSGLRVARCWIDTSGDKIISPGEEVEMATSGGSFWTSSYKPKLQTTYGLLRFRAPTGTSWELTVTDETGTVLQKKQGSTTSPISQVLLRVEQPGGAQ